MFAKVAALLLFLSFGSAQAGGLIDAGDQIDAGCDDAGTCAADGGMDAGFPLACDGGLCDTTNGASCSSVSAPVNLAWLAVVVAAFAFPTLRRRNRAMRGGGRHD